jgi:hypothetical protein
VQPVFVADVHSTHTVQIESKFLCQETGSYLTKDKIKTFVPYGGERVYISKDEMSDVKKIADKGKKIADKGA